MKLIRITSGPQAGRYVGRRFGGGYVSNPDLQKNPPVNMPEANYGLWPQPDGATHYFDHKMDTVQAVQAELQRHGYETEVIDAPADFLSPDPATQA